MERWIDGSAPSATNTSPMAVNGNVGLSVSAADPIETWAVDIRPEGGGASLVAGLEVDAEGKIWLPESNLTPDVTNYLRVRRDDGEAGAYSNAVTVAYDPDVNAQSANQVRAVSVSRSGTNVQVRWQLFQANGKALRLYYQRADGGGTLLLTPAGLASGTTTFSIQNQSLTVQCGYFYLTQQISGSNWSGPSPAAGLPPSGSSTEFGASQDCDPPSPPPPSAPVWVDTFHHRDHLGSLRIVTDAGGWVVPGGRHDYYPFGMEMVPTNTFTGGGSRKRFTGHERDEASGLDYMLARYLVSTNMRFTTVDLDPVVRLARPAAWNRYTYVSSSPLNAIDPDGNREAVLYGEIHNVEPGDVVVLAKNESGDPAHTVIVGDFNYSDAGVLPNALVYELAFASPPDRVTAAKGTDDVPQNPGLVDSNSADAGAGKWNAARTYVSNVVPNRKADGRDFTPAEVASAVVSGGPVTYNQSGQGKTTRSTDCAGFVNRVVKALGGTLSPWKQSTLFNLFPGAKRVADWNKLSDPNPRKYRAEPVPPKLLAPTTNP